MFPERRLGDRRGATLTEIAVVLGILGFLAALGLPSFQGWREANELRDAAGEMMGVMLSARMRSIVEWKNFTLGVDYAAETYTLTPAGGTAQPASGQIWRTIDVYPDDGDPDCPALSAASIVFRPDGTADAVGFEAVYLRSKSSRVPNRYRIKVLGATGKVGQEKWDGSSWVSAF